MTGILGEGQLGDFVLGESKFSPLSTGGIQLTTNPFDPTTYEIWININQDFTWTLGAFFGVNQQFSWDVGDVPLFWYQIMGGCNYDVNCDTAGVNPDDANCQGLQGQKYEQIAAARSVSDLCSKLKEEFLVRPLKLQFKTIKKYSLPTYTSNDTTENGCYNFIDETFCEIPECYEFCLAVDGAVSMGFATVFIEAFRHTSAVFTIYTGGAAPADTPPPQASMSGGLITGGAANHTSSAWSYVVGEDYLEVSGVAELKSSSWHYVAFDGLVAYGNADVVSPSYTYEASDDELYISGEAISQSHVIFRANITGIGVLISGTADIVGSFVASAEGGLVTSGTAPAFANAHMVVSSGGVFIGGSAGIVSPSMNYTGSGTITLGSLYQLGLTYLASGGVIVSGNAEEYLVYDFESSGEVVISGSAEITSSAFSGAVSGGLITSGAAEVTSSWLGQFNVGMGADSVLSDLGAEETVPILEFTTEIPVYAPLDTPTNCDCDLSLELEMRHNLADSNILSNFLVRNEHTIPDKIYLIYNPTRDAWQANFHYRGIGNDTKEFWNFLFELECTDVVGDVELGEYVWKFNLDIRRTFNNNNNDIRTRTRFASAFSIFGSLQPAGVLNLKFNLDTQTGNIFSSSYAVPSYYIFSDKIGLFTNTYWSKIPELKIHLSESKIPASLYRYPLVLEQEDVVTVGTGSTVPSGEDLVAAVVGQYELPGDNIIDTSPIYGSSNASVVGPVPVSEETGTAGEIIGPASTPVGRTPFEQELGTPPPEKPSPYQESTRTTRKGRARTLRPYIRKGTTSPLPTIFDK